MSSSKYSDPLLTNFQTYVEPEYAEKSTQVDFMHFENDE